MTSEELYELMLKAWRVIEHEQRQAAIAYGLMGPSDESELA